jgi:hypothetical protein
VKYLKNEEKECNNPTLLFSLGFQVVTFLPSYRVERVAFPSQPQASARFHLLQIFSVKNIYRPVMLRQGGLMLVTLGPDSLRCEVPLRRR